MITTPLFTRLMSTEDYGMFHNYSSWLGIVTVFITLNLEATLISAKYDYEDDFDGYILSMLGLSGLSSLLWVLVFNLFSGFFSQLFGMSMYYVNAMCITLLLNPVITMYMARERYLFNYKKNVLLSLVTSLSTALVSVLLVVLMQDKLKGRVLGSFLPLIPICAFLLPGFFRRGKSIRIGYWKYALPICLPYIPHILSLSVLNSMDQIMITKICGAADNAIYSLAYACASLITVLVGALNSAFAPWIGEKLHQKKYSEINKVSKTYMVTFIALAVLVVLGAPEVIAIFGGEKYQAGIWVLPPVATGIMLQFLYCLFVNVEQFEKKTKGMAIASVTAAGLNFVLNSIFIPKYGFIAAAYTTFASYLWMLLLHMFLVYCYGYKEVYDYKLVVILIFLCTGIMFVCNALYGHEIIRYIILGIYLLILSVVFFRKKQIILGLFKKRESQS